MITYASSRYKWGLQTTTLPSRFIKEIKKDFVELPHDFEPKVPEVNEDAVFQRRKSEYKQNYPRLQKRSHETIGEKQLMKMDSAASKQGTPSTADNVEVGMRVEHARFGLGTVEKIEGSAPNAKATVSFPIGKKQLLLKFAKLRIVE